MAELVLFHHAQGLTEGVHAFADSLRAQGHTVRTPDLYQGRVFQTLDAGVAHAQEVGFGELIERGVQAAGEADADVVYGGFSLGVLPAQRLAQNRPGARAALLLHACVPVTEFSSTWPRGVAVQVHAMEADPFFVDDGDLEAAQALVNEATQAGTPAELFCYPGDQHLFTDSSLPSYDAEATDLVLERVLAFLSGND